MEKKPKTDPRFLGTAVELHIDGFQTREVLKFSYSFNRTTDIEGQITGVPRGGKISLTVKARNDGNNELLYWMLALSSPKSGSIQFKQRNDTGAIMKKINFFNAQCIDYTEDWEEGKMNNNIIAYDTHTEKIVFSCKGIDNGGVEYDFIQG